MSGLQAELLVNSLDGVGGLNAESLKMLMGMLAERMAKDIGDEDLQPIVEQLSKSRIIITAKIAETGVSDR